MPRGTRWARAPSGVNAALGVWVLLSPWLLGFDQVGPPAWNARITGMAITAIAVATVSGRYPTVAWGNVVAGAWLFVSPWVLGYTDVRAAAQNAYAVGIVVGLFALITANFAFPIPDDHRPPTQLHGR